MVGRYSGTPGSPTHIIPLASARLNGAGRANLAVSNRCRLGRLARCNALVQPADVARSIEHARIFNCGGIPEVAVHTRDNTATGHLDVVES